MLTLLSNKNVGAEIKRYFFITQKNILGLYLYIFVSQKGTKT